jgi:hypothetical protein
MPIISVMFADRRATSGSIIHRRDSRVPQALDSVPWTAFLCGSGKSRGGRVIASLRLAFVLYKKYEESKSC